MTREEAIKLLCVEKSIIVEVDGNKGAEKMLQAYDMAVEALSAESVHGWIPCSERLPIENGRYLVTFPLFTLQRTWIDILWYGNPTLPNRRVKGKCWYRTDDEWGDVVYDEVTAWMPLPEPYEGGDAE